MCTDISVLHTFFDTSTRIITNSFFTLRHDKHGTFLCAYLKVHSLLENKQIVSLCIGRTQSAFTVVPISYFVIVHEA
jgi:hypothetical protein